MAADQGTEPPVAARETESPAEDEQLMEQVVSPANAQAALERVMSNRGAPGVDGMTVDELPDWLRMNWRALGKSLLDGSYRPQPVVRVEIPKPSGGMRKLGIPTVVDRFVQQMLLQVLQRRLDPQFSDCSYGFRPGRSAHQAVAQAQEYIAEGCRWVVDIDLEKFFDRVNHDMLMGRLAKRVSDRRVLRVVRAFLNAGVMEDGLVHPSDEGTPQGGPLSPLLSNLLLDDLDRELEKRGLSFVRYADDCNIYVRSRRAGERVMASVTRWLEKKLKLRVNREKSAVDRPWRRKFLGFSFTHHRQPKRRIAPQSVVRFKQRVRSLTRRNTGQSLQSVVARLSRYLRGWLGYFGFCQTPSVLAELHSWIHRRLRCLVWKQWKRGRTRFRELIRRGVSAPEAAKTAGSAHALWRVSRTPALNMALPNAYFAELGLPQLRVRNAASI
ncbi:MAG: group II intron reverse transcriptase/maturase [Anaerolineae bacterium]